MYSKWCIISDIDDTVLETSTGYLPVLSAFFHTFLKHPKPVKGMPELYRIIQLSLPQPRFWYISASPYKLFPYFRSRTSLKEYPNGNVVLPSREESFRIYLTRSVYKYKLECLEKLYHYYSARRIVLIGDSLMKDPEIYGEIYRRHPQWIIGILIRIVGQEHAYRNSIVRFEKSFAEVPFELCYIFRKPGELNVYLNNILDCEN